MKNEFCKNGHEYTDKNTIILKNGNKRCRTCKNIQSKKRYKKLGITCASSVAILDPDFDDFGWSHE